MKRKEEPKTIEAIDIKDLKNSDSQILDNDGKKSFRIRKFSRSLSRSSRDGSMDS